MVRVTSRSAAVAVILVSVALFVLASSCSGGTDREATDRTDGGCSVEIVSIEFEQDAPLGEVNQIFRAASELDGIRLVKRAEELGDPPLVEVTTVDGVGASELAEIVASSSHVSRSATRCAAS